MTARLHYFKGRGRAETTRWMLAAAGVEFETIDIAVPSDLAALRASGLPPFGQLPVLEIDGLALSQSSAMVRYLARRADLYGDSDLDAVWADMVVGVIADFGESAITAAFQPGNGAEQNLRTAIAKFGPPLERRVGVTGWMAGNRMSFADVIAAEALTHATEWVPDLLQEFPGLDDLRGRVVATPEIAGYLASPQRWHRPDDQYVIDVARVLERALPAHMPDTDRFVR